MSKILVVEDDTASQTVIGLMLQRLGGHEVLICEDGDDVLEHVRSGRADLVIMDVRLTRTKVEGETTDGVRLAQILKSDPETRIVPIVMVTAHAMRGDAERFLAKSGADYYVSKPITDLHDFARLVENLIRTNPVID